MTENQNQEKPLNQEAAKSNPTTGSKVCVPIKRVEFNVFFDGTWNSKFNSNWYNNSDWYMSDERTYDDTYGYYKDEEAKKAGNLSHQSHSDDKKVEQAMKEAFKADQTSYARAPTGVDQMHRASKTDNSYIIPLYVDGSGTTTPADDPYQWEDINQYVPESADDMKNDSFVGSGLGWGGTGVVAKLDKMCELVQDKLDKLQNDCPDSIGIIMFNVYGFSRGAATARMFVNRVVKEQMVTREGNDIFGDEVEETILDLTKYAVMVKFVGLFDTVSSVGLSHNNDVEGYHEGTGFTHQSSQHNESVPSDALDFDERVITGKVVHLVAGHEFRQKYSVTNIKQAVERGYGFEVVLPGNHTDIGDGKSTRKEYNDKTQQWRYVGHQDNKTILQHDKYHYLSLSTLLAPLAPFADTVRSEYSTKADIQDTDLEKVKDILINQGWYTNQNNEDRIWIEEDSRYTMLKAKRTLSQDYPKIPTWIMIELMKEMGEYKLDDADLKKYAIKNNDTSPETEEIYQHIKSGVMTLWENESKGYAEDKIINNQQHLLPYVTIADEKLRKTMFNRYLQWSTSFDQGILKDAVSVNMGRINPKTNQFYRKVING